MARKPRMKVNEDGSKVVEMEFDGDEVDLSIPQKDEDGIVPEFVNVSPQIQQITVPNNPSGTIVVERYAILRGAQHRAPYATPRNSGQGAFGRFPPFIERRKGVERATEENPGGFNTEYLLEEDQAIEHVRKLGVRESVEHRLNRYSDNARFAPDKSGEPVFDPETGLEIRKPEDRSAVLVEINAKMRKIYDLKREKERIA